MQKCSFLESLSLIFYLIRWFMSIETIILNIYWYILLYRMFIIFLWTWFASRFLLSKSSNLSKNAFCVLFSVFIIFEKRFSQFFNWILKEDLFLIDFFIMRIYVSIFLSYSINFTFGTIFLYWFTTFFLDSWWCLK